MVSIEDKVDEYEGSPSGSDGEQDQTKPSGKIWKEILRTIKENKKVNNFGQYFANA